ncbi:MAG: phosphoribosylformylglycinamidine synthase subunit PurL [Dehalococcoidia bacterium]|nr:phosphoribosylformylglycinamidine synthase subunit PurL [Dehalococcoidia bacterium]MCB9486199.1 phosphoribosylformylglycinamidine synthase subunit PurL [Thermoflexaceae bacterium]
MPVTQEALDAVALSREEYALLVQQLGREPNEVELGMFGSLWSEHCGYKNSKPLLRLFPTGGDRVLTRAGAENAGAIDIGDGLCIVMKVESHNHPSAIEPYEGAATGVGGIVRDIFAMGAYPIAILDSLRFGPLSSAQNRYLFNGVVAGVGGYGNCLGIPNVGGEVFFSTGYDGNPLVNAMCVGLAETSKLVSARARGIGNPLLLVGADTGRDGIHGASGLASRTDPEARFEEMRPAVQVGNPFMEKLLMEACYELASEHGDWIVGLQDLGAAGLTSSIVECCAKGGVGALLDLDQVPRREDGMTPYEVMLSESQERMIVIAKREHAADVAALFARWELHCNEIGEVTEGREVVISSEGVEVARVPVDIATEPPEYTRVGVAPAYLADLNSFDLSALPDIDPGDATAALLSMLARPNVASRRGVYRQYDQQVLNNTVVAPGGDAAVLRIAGTTRGIALATDCNARVCYLDPYVGGALAVAEAARNVVCTGASPVAVTDCLNFGDPTRLDVYFQMSQAVHGISEACSVFDTPVVSGNVSLFNQTGDRPIYPTPVIGILGLIEDVSHRLQAGFTHPGCDVWLLGSSVEQPAASLAASEYLESEHGLVAGCPSVDLQAEARLQRLILRAHDESLLQSAHDCSEGGLAVTLAESAMLGGAGFEGFVEVTGRLDAGLFGEAAGRIVVSVVPDIFRQGGGSGRMGDLARSAGVPAVRIGRTNDSGAFRFGPIDATIPDLIEAWESLVRGEVPASIR